LRGIADARRRHAVRFAQHRLFAVPLELQPPEVSDVHGREASTVAQKAQDALPEGYPLTVAETP